MAAVYVFGSTARGTARADSDLDVASLWSRSGGAYPVEVRTRNEAFDLEPILLRYRALRDAR